MRKRRHRNWIRMPIGSAAVIALIAACSSQAPEPGQNLANVTVVDGAAGSSAPENGSGPVGTPGTVGGLPDDRSQLEEPQGPIDPASAEAAGQVVQRYGGLLEQRKFVEARNLWGDGGKASGLTEPQFVAAYDKYASIHSEVGRPADMEGAAGSSYVDYPVQLYGRLRNGKEFNARGTMTLRRVNDVPGSTEEQRKWHIYRADFPKKTAADYRFVGRWAANVGNCPGKAWRFTATSLNTPAGSQCTFRKVTEVPGGYDIAARCTAEGPPTDDTLKLRFAESAKALLFESDVIADAGLVRCS